MSRPRDVVAESDSEPVVWVRHWFDLEMTEPPVSLILLGEGLKHQPLSGGMSSPSSSSKLY